ncbi:DUF4124 domain-containing protein [Roseateles sp. DAIF2]|uniref:DUF4124 domain-containing protein n=1 Tax=Roseateles sp. DAIF2 TaxID=2714952 RepID=UPI00201D77E6|nr:DUF4124 domain-containing protein [Roseateles sp. DAIF2]
MIRLAVAALMLCLATGAQAQWKWRDTAGKVQYSDLPPPQGTPEKDILQRPPGLKAPVVIRPFGQAASAPAPAPASTAASAAPSKAELEQQAKQKAEQEQQAKKQKDEEKRVAEQRADNCKRATAHLRMLEDGVRITQRNQAGETVFLDEKQRAEELQRTRGLVASECR